MKRIIQAINRIVFRHTIAREEAAAQYLADCNRRFQSHFSPNYAIVAKGGSYGEWYFKMLEAHHERMQRQYEVVTEQIVEHHLRRISNNAKVLLRAEKAA